MDTFAVVHLVRQLTSLLRTQLPVLGGAREHLHFTHSLVTGRGAGHPVDIAGRGTIQSQVHVDRGHGGRRAVVYGHLVDATGHAHTQECIGHLRQGVHLGIVCTHLRVYCRNFPDRTASIGFGHLLNFRSIRRHVGTVFIESSKFKKDGFKKYQIYSFSSFLNTGNTRFVFSLLHHRRDIASRRTGRCRSARNS